MKAQRGYTIIDLAFVSPGFSPEDRTYKLAEMSDSGSNTTGSYVLRLDPSLYKLGDEEASFFKQYTGINDDEELRQHILQVQKEAYKVRDITRQQDI